MAEVEHKVNKITLMRLGNSFEVKTITNSSWYIPGDHVTRETLKKICETPGWDVTVVDNDIIKLLLGGLGGAAAVGAHLA